MWWTNIEDGGFLRVRRQLQNAEARILLKTLIRNVHSLRSDRAYHDRAAWRLIVGDPVLALFLLSNCNYVHGREPQ